MMRKREAVKAFKCLMLEARKKSKQFLNDLLFIDVLFGLMGRLVVEIIRN